MGVGKIFSKEFWEVDFEYCEVEFELDIITT